MENKLVSMNKAEITKAGVQKVAETYVNSITAHLKTIHIDVRAEQTQAIMFGIQKLNAMIDANKDKLTFKDLDYSSSVSALTMVALTEINMMSFKPDGYFELRKDFKTGKYTVNFQPQGNGSRNLVQKFGVDVEKVYDPWIVKEGDEFIYPHFKGLEMTPPEWTPKGDDRGEKIDCHCGRAVGFGQYGLMKLAACHLDGIVLPGLVGESHDTFLGLHERHLAHLMGAVAITVKGLHAAGIVEQEAAVLAFTLPYAGDIECRMSANLEMHLLDVSIMHMPDD